MQANHHTSSRGRGGEYRRYYVRQTRHGYGLLRRVRALPPEQGGDTPAVAITAFAPSEGRRRALMAGFQMHVPKPVEPAELIAIVTSHFNAQRRTGMTKGG
jgi:CheY-like chemotaxis protein